MYCTRCGTLVEAGSKFCKNCGLNLNSSNEPKPDVEFVQNVQNSSNTVIYSGKANHFLNIESVGGNLFLYPDRLYFKSHALNIQTHDLTVKLNQIQSINYYNTLGIVPNGLAVNLHNGKTEKFVVWKRDVWKNEIEKLLPRS